MSDVEAAVAKPAERAVIASLMQLYFHDFSALWAGTDRGELQQDGRYEDYPDLDAYWHTPDHIPLLLTKRGLLIGFALINCHSHSGGQIDWNVAEFFIVRKHRRSGNGSAAVATITHALPGRWEAAVVRKNVAALSFWRRAISAIPHVRAFEEIDVASDDWNGPVLRFVVDADDEKAAER